MRDDQRRLILNMIFIGIPLIFLLMPFTQPYMVVSLGIALHGALWFLDCVAGAHILGMPSYASWALVGTGIGCALGFWTVAPSIGKRHMRRIVVLIPFIVLGGLTLLDLTYSVMNPPPPPAQTAPVTNPPVNNFGRPHASPGAGITPS